MKTDLLYGIVPISDSKTRVRCVFCGVCIPRSSKCIEEHTNGIRHNDNMDLMAENGLRFKNNEIHCKPCKCILGAEESVLKHIESDDHANWIAAIEDLVDDEFIDLSSYLSTNVEQVSCEVCNTSMECTLPVIEEHVNSFDHRAKACEKLKPLNGIFAVENSVDLWCKVCNMNIQNTVKSVLAHIDDGVLHTEWLWDIEELIEDHEISLVPYLTNKDEKDVFCNKCQVKVTCNRQSIEDHVNSDAHLAHFS